MMDTDPLSVKLSQPTLFDMGDASSGALELFPEVWSATEALTYTDDSVRQSGLERLIALSAARFSPLVAYILATRLTDPDLKLRAGVVRALSEVLAPDEQGNLAPDAVRQHLVNYLSQMRTRQVYALLQVIDYEPSVEPFLIRLLNACPFAGNHLADILSDRKAPVSIRKQAAHLVGRVGYLDALPALERIASRLESKLNGQQAMPFAPQGQSNELALLPEVKASLALLRAP